jgi:translation initiation factor 2 beta subunit (eIF-2beta)/eIF-5
MDELVEVFEKGFALLATTLARPETDEQAERLYASNLARMREGKLTAILSSTTDISDIVKSPEEEAEFLERVREETTANRRLKDEEKLAMGQAMAAEDQPTMHERSI